MIIGFVGRRGGGKTLSMIRQAYNDYLNGRVVYSNIKLSFPHELITKELLLTFANTDNSLSNAIVLIDELHMYMDSRLSASKRNLLISYFLLQSRKRDVDVYFTTQNLSQVDKRMRQQMDMVSSCSSIKVNKDTPQELVYIRNVIMDVETKKRAIQHYLGNKYYSLYDSYEIVGFD